MVSSLKYKDIAVNNILGTEVKSRNFLHNSILTNTKTAKLNSTNHYSHITKHYQTNSVLQDTFYQEIFNKYKNYNKEEEKEKEKENKVTTKKKGSKHKLISELVKYQNISNNKNIINNDEKEEASNNIGSKKKSIIINNLKTSFFEQE